MVTFPLVSAPIENHVDALLQQFAAEIACYVRARDGLRILSLRLSAAIIEYLRLPSDGELLNQVLALRRQHANRRGDLRDVYERWEKARGAGETLWSALPAMSPPQTRRFDLLVAKDREMAEERQEFEQISQRLRGLLLLFGEVFVD